MDGGLKIENCIRRAVREQTDFYHFADHVRLVAVELGLSDGERDRIFGALADIINDFMDSKNI